MSASFGAGFSGALGVSASAGISVGATGTATAGNGDSLLRAFRFHVELKDAASGAIFGDGAFQECSGLEIEQDVQEYLEGGLNDEVIKRVGRAKFQPLVLKRGMLYSHQGQVDGRLWRWIQEVVGGVRPVMRLGGTVQVMSVRDDVVVRWEFWKGLPARLRGPELNAKTGEIAIEELHIAHQGLRLLLQSGAGGAAGAGLEASAGVSVSAGIGVSASASFGASVGGRIG
jgi:phage tail-like protein